MPRPNQPRSIASELALARRIAHERETRGMSYEGLASRMTKAGCPIQSSAIYKIEKSDPPRRITVDELVAFSQVFAIPVENLLLPPEIAQSKELADLVVKWNYAREDATRAELKEREAWESLAAYVNKHPDVEPALEAVLTQWVEYYFEESKRDGALATWMHKLTGGEAWEARLDEYLNDKRDQRAAGDS